MQINRITAPIAAEVRQDVESEAAIIQRVKAAISTCNWTIGEGASLWTERWSKGRTDEDFGAAVGISGDKAYQCRRVWDRFRDSELIRKLSWTHFYVALTWDDADACLQWAYENYSTVAEMKAWRNAQHGEPDSSASNGSGDPFVSDEDPFGDGDEGAGTEAGGDGWDASGEEDGTETGGTDSEEEQPARPPRNGREASAGRSKTKQELIAEQKSKTIKTLEAGSRAIGDLHALEPFPQDDAMIKALRKMIETVRARK